MTGRARRIMAIGAVTAAVVAVGGTALGAHDSGGSSFLDDFARHLGVSPSKVRSAFAQTVHDRLQALVEACRLTQAQANAIEARMKALGGPPFVLPGPVGVFGLGPFDRDHGMRPEPLPMLHAAATYLGVSDESLRASVRSGRTLAQIATAKGKSVTGLEQAMTAAAAQGLDDAVASGRLTKAEAARIRSELAEHIDDFVHGFRFHRPPAPPWLGPGWSAAPV